LSADGRSVAVARIESGSFTIRVLSVAGKGRETRAFHAADVSDLQTVKTTVRAVNAFLQRGGYRRLPELPLPAAGTLRLQHGVGEVRMDEGRLEIACDGRVIGRSRRLTSVRDRPLGLHHEVLTGLFLAAPPAFAVMKVEPVDANGFYLPGGVEWILVPLTACS
jgi:hypothetical protein